MEYKTIIVTGGAGIIGREIVRSISSQGFEIVVLGRRSRHEIHSLIPQVSYFSCDITDSGQIEECVTNIIRHKPPLYGLINCVGVNKLKVFEEYSFDDFQELISVNLIGSAIIIKYTLPSLKRQRFGKIINIASQAGIVPQEHNTLYSVAKAGIVALTKALARECAAFNISINSICPGDIESEMMERAVNDLSKIEAKSVQEIQQEIINRIPSGRFGLPTEIAELVKEILMIKTQYLTGANIVIAGGRTCY